LNIAWEIFHCYRSIRGLCCINSMLGRHAHIYAYHWLHLCLDAIDDSHVEAINCSTFQYIKGCRTHGELKVLVSKFNMKNNNKCVFWVLGISVQGNKYRKCNYNKLNALFQVKPNPLCNKRTSSSVFNKRQMFPCAVWIYLAYKFPWKYERVSCQVLFTSDEAKNSCSHNNTMLQTPNDCS
jgi:hypothetical protein